MVEPNQEKRVAALGDLVAEALDATVENWRTSTVSGLAIDSRQVAPGDLFIAVPGLATDGHRFIAAAAKAGAHAAVVEHITGDSLLQIKVRNARRAIAEIAHRYYDHPARQMKLFGVTGTNGKTTVAAVVEAIAHAAGQKIGVLGTVGHRLDSLDLPASRTTPEAHDIDRMLANMLRLGITVCVMEVSSHALKLDRVFGVPFSGAVFTNLTRDHLDFHGDLDEYRRTKFRLFTENLQPGGFAVFNGDDPAGAELAGVIGEATAWRYSLKDKSADIHVRVHDETLLGSAMTFFTPVGVMNIKTPLWGAFNFANLAAAVGTAIAVGYSPEAIVEGIAEFHGVRGRMEAISGDFDFSVFIDYAHTPDALYQVLAAARPLVKGKLRVLFGCGGDRDAGKRPLMAQAVEQFADIIYLTSDNPRSEDPVKIISDVMKGFSDPDAVIVEPDRGKAIERIILECHPADSALLCGKGHETMQLIGEDAIEFDDRTVAERALRTRGCAVGPA
jgi:UDP-N-acetylmuramoyl-L-alanyl-D-glutamate--2,6-diaminopimelate ligase